MTEEQYREARVQLAKAQGRLLLALRTKSIEEARRHIHAALDALSCYGKGAT